MKLNETNNEQSAQPKPQPKQESDEETMRRKLENLDRVKVPSKPSVLGIVIILFVSAVFGYFGSQSLSRFGAEGGFWNVVGTLFYYRHCFVDRRHYGHC